jgi:hypothetical protein
MKKPASSLIRSLLPVLTIFVILILLVGCGAGPDNTTPTTSNGTNNGTGPNLAPVIDNIIPEWTEIERGKTSKVKCIAHDPDGDTLTYKWKVSRGGISGEGPLAIIATPSSYVDLVVSVTVTDGRGGMAASEIIVPVVCCGYAKENPEWSE